MAAVVLLLTGCSLPDINLQDINTAWVNGLAISTTLESVSAELAARYSIRVIVALLWFAYVVLELRSKHPDWGRRITTSAVAMLIIADFPVLKLLLGAALKSLTPTDYSPLWIFAKLTLGDISQANGIELLQKLPQVLANPKAVLVVFGITAWLPLLSQLVEYVVIWSTALLAFVALVTKSDKPFGVAFGGAVGWVLFPLMHSGVVSTLAAYNTSTFASTGLFFSYTAATLGVAILCYVVVPLAIAWFTPPDIGGYTAAAPAGFAGGALAGSSAGGNSAKAGNPNSTSQVAGGQKTKKSRSASQLLAALAGYGVSTATDKTTHPRRGSGNRGGSRNKSSRSASTHSSTASNDGTSANSSVPTGEKSKRSRTVARGTNSAQAVSPVVSSSGTLLRRTGQQAGIADEERETGVYQRSVSNPKWRRKVMPPPPDALRTDMGVEEDGSKS